MERTRVIFYHIPKSGGTSFGNILRGQFPKDRQFHVDGGSLTSAIKYYTHTRGILRDIDKTIIKNSDLIYGHMPFEINNDYSQFSPVTFLREPTSRVISDYLYTKETSFNPLHHIVNQLTLKEYVSNHQDLHLDNLQTRIISGNIEGNLNVSDVDRAEYNLINHFRFFGLTEDFKNSLVWLNQTFGWDITQYAIKNVTKNRSSKSQFSEADLAAVGHFNNLDKKLYNRVSAIFNEMVAKKINYFENESKKIHITVGKSGGFVRRLIRKLSK